MKKKRGTKKIKKEVVEKEEESKVIKEQTEALSTVSTSEGSHNTTVDLSNILSSSLSSESSEENFPLDPMDIREISAKISASEFISSRRKREIWDEICSEAASSKNS